MHRSVTLTEPKGGAFQLPEGMGSKITAGDKEKSDRTFIYETVFYFYWLIILNL